MDFNQIRYFIALSETLNFTHAADKCYVSQPALTQAIRRLESELGGKLVRRQGRLTQLTELGESMCGYFKSIEQTRHMVRATAKAITLSDKDELNVGVVSTLGSKRIAKLIEAFVHKFPQTSIQIHDLEHDSIEEMMSSNTLDIVFCVEDTLLASELDYTHLYEEPIVVAFPEAHAFSKMDKIPLNMVVKEPYIDRFQCEFRNEMFTQSQEQDFVLNVVLRSQREDWAQRLVKGGVGVSIFPEYSLTDPDVDYREVCNPTLNRNVGFVVSKRFSQLVNLENFIEHINQAC